MAQTVEARSAAGIFGKDCDAEHPYPTSGYQMFVVTCLY